LEIELFLVKPVLSLIGLELSSDMILSGYSPELKASLKMAPDLPSISVKINIIFKINGFFL